MNDASILGVVPVAIMLLIALAGMLWRSSDAAHWQLWVNGASLALCFSLMLALLVMADPKASWPILHAAGLQVSPLQALIAILAQGLGLVVGRFSCRYLEGEANQQRYIVSLGMVLVCVHLLLMADHWLILVLAWSGIGVFLRNMLCFYEQRPFALLASHKKTVADLMADALLLLAAMLSWISVGNGSISSLLAQVSTHGHQQLTAACTLLLVGAVVLRTALFPVHGWLIQVMEAPTPVSALLHAGVINLSGYLLIRFAPLFSHHDLANGLLLGMGLVTCVLASLVMFTRVSIKVKLAWSTVAQMGFMMVECALGLYTFAVMHLIGHSIYKAYAFLSASSAVAHTRVKHLAGNSTFHPLSFMLAPLLAFAIVSGVHAQFHAPLWPVWWSAILALAWATLFWTPVLKQHAILRLYSLISGAVMTAMLTLVSAADHLLPLGVADQPRGQFAAVVVIAMALLYLFGVLIEVMPARLRVLHRWLYAGLYLDDFYTRYILRLWPVHWGKSTHAQW